MGMIDQKLGSFTEDLASKAPVPGGGGTAALVGALAASLGEMVASLTIGKKKYADVEADMVDRKEEMDLLRKKLLFLVDQDAAAFRPLAEAYKMPTETEADRAKKAEIMEACLQDAATVPLEIMRTCADVIKLMRFFAENGSRLAISDAGCGASLAKAALESAALNVFINTTSMDYRKFADAAEQEAAALLDEYRPQADAVYRMVLTEILT